MRTLQNLHTHSNYSDGKNSLREMAESAFLHGLESLGFSDHMYTGIPVDLAGMKKGRFSSYLSEISELKKNAPVKIFCGLELESRYADNSFAQKDKALDYAIGSVHFYHLKKSLSEEVLHFVDWDLEHYKAALDAFGSARAMCENYYSEVVAFAENSNYDITGHFDLLTKFLDMTDMSFTSSPWYKDLALNALDAVFACGKIFEINTGAVARGWRKSPYLQSFLLKRLKELNAPVLISSDCHALENVVFGFEETEALLKSFGFKEQMVLTSSGFQKTAL